MRHPSTARIVICAKSEWNPAIRREHALAQASVALGHDVQFVERPRDVRTWLRGRSTPVTSSSAIPVVLPRRCLAPGHRGAVLESLDNAVLARSLRRMHRARAVDSVVVNTPWQWGASAGLQGVRRIFDAADDWRTLLPGRELALEKMYERISDEADAIILVSDSLQSVFRGRGHVVRNAVDSELLRATVETVRSPRRMVYVGTLSERFDAALVSDAMRALPEWEIEMYGQCQYAGQGDLPGPSLVALLSEHPRRARWMGTVDRRDLATVLDAADVLVIPNKVQFTEGQDSMKLFDYSARGKPVVTTGIRLAGDSPPDVVVASSVAGFAAAVESASGVESSRNRLWAQDNTWEVRVEEWLAVVLGASGRPKPVPGDGGEES